jgi:four helix bundle protein
VNTDDPLDIKSYELAHGVGHFVLGLEPNRVTIPVANQLIRSATGTASNYRAARRARSRADFISRLGIVLEEADESDFWLNYLLDFGFGEPEIAKPLITLCDEIMAMAVCAKATALKNGKKRLVKRSSKRRSRR